MMSRYKEDVTVVVEKESMTANIKSGKHTFIADEPEELGGSNAGPDPYTYLMGALGACTAITLRMYARRKQWPLERIMVKLSHGKNHAEDCQDCDKDAARLDYIQKELIMEGDLSAEQKERLKIIADKCPVQKTLEAGINIVTWLA